jgi:hypothetical protein
VKKRFAAYIYLIPKVSGVCNGVMFVARYYETGNGITKIFINFIYEV